MLTVGCWLLTLTDERVVQNTGRERHWQARIPGKTENGVDSARGGADFPRPFDAGWSSLVARQAHNLKVVGSNPTPAPNLTPLDPPIERGFWFSGAEGFGWAIPAVFGRGFPFPFPFGEQGFGDHALVRPAGFSPEGAGRAPYGLRKPRCSFPAPTFYSGTLIHLSRLGPTVLELACPGPVGARGV